VVVKISLSGSRPVHNLTSQVGLSEICPAIDKKSSVAGFLVVWQVTLTLSCLCLCLLDLSAAFGTIDHDILLTRLSSWFGIHGSVLNWFKTYLSSRTFSVKCNDCFSSLHTSLYGIPQGSVLGPLLFIMHTTPLSTLIPSLSLYHHLCADDTQLFLNFHPSDFQANISHLQNALTQITSWMTSNLLSLNSSKTEFLLIGLKWQLSKIHNSSTSIDTTQSACNLGFIFDKHLSFFDQISALSESCYHHIRAVRCIRPYLDLHTAKTVATSIVHSKLDYCNSLYYGLPKFQINRLQHIQNALARTVVPAPKLQHIAPILKSLHWLEVSERIEYKIISHLQNYQYHSAFVSIWPCIYSASSWSQHTLFTLCHSHQTIIITQSYSSILSTCFTSSLEPASYITQNSSSKLFIPFSATFIWTCWFNFLVATHCYHLPSLFHCFTLSSKPTFSEILSSTIVCFCLSDWSHSSRPFTGLICSSVSCFSSIFSVLVIPKCGRLSWPALWSTFRRTVK